MLIFGEMNMSSSLRSTLPTFANTAGFPTAATSKAAVAYDDAGDSIYYSDGTNWIQLSLPSGTSNQTLRYTGTAWAATGGLLSTGTQVSVVGNNFDAHVAGAALRVQGAYLLIGDEVTSATMANGLGIKFHDATVGHYSQKFDSTAGEMQFGPSSSVSHLQFDTNALTMRIGNGKVSIGAPAPATSGGATLQVVGNVSITTMTATPTGIVGRDGSNVLGMVGLSTGLTVSSGTLTLGSELQGLAGLATTGLVTRTAANTYTGRTLAVANDASSFAQLTISNANGVSGNPTITIDTSKSTVRMACRVATTANITLSGTQTIDGVAVVAGDRVLVKNQTTASANGTYVCAAGAWTRTTGFDTSADANMGVLIYVQLGTAGGGTYWKLNEFNITLGTTALSFSQVLTTALTGTGSTNKLAIWSGTSGLTFDSNISADLANDRIGIGAGATAPVTTLHVAGLGSFGDSVTASNAVRALNINSTDAVARILRVSADINTAAPGVELMHRTTADGANSQYWDVYLKSTGFWIRDRTSADNDRLHINTAGEVGIGTTAVSGNRLTANGAIRAEGTLVARGVGNSYTGDLATAHVRLWNTTAGTGDIWYIGSRNDGSLDIQSGSLTQVARFNATTGRFDLSYSFGLVGSANSASLAASQNNYDIADGGASTVHRLTASTPINITGMVGGVAGRVISLINIGTNTITLTNEDVNSTAANRFALGADLAITGSNAVTLWYDGTSSRWRPFGGSGGGGSSDAPVGAQYLTLATDATLTNERVFTAGQNVVVTDGGAGSTYTVAVGTQTFALNGIISPTGTTGTVNDYAPTSLSTAAIIRQTTTAATTLTGLTGGSSGRIIVFFNIGTHDIDFINESASSTAANRFSFGVDYRLGPNKSLILWYDSTSSRWRAAGIEDDPSTRVTIVAKTASHTLAIGDASKLITMDSASNITLTIPTNATVAFPIGTVVSVVRLNTGKVNIAGSGGVTVNSADGDLYLRSRYSAVTLTKMATNTWLVTGDLTVT